MDDRSLVATDKQTLDNDVALTEQFDQEVGLKENMTKRPAWAHADDEPRRIEHLGSPQSYQTRRPKDRTTYTTP